MINFGDVEFRSIEPRKHTSMISPQYEMIFKGSIPEELRSRANTMCIVKRIPMYFDEIHNTDSITVYYKEKKEYNTAYLTMTLFKNKIPRVSIDIGLMDSEKLYLNKIMRCNINKKGS